MKRLLLVPLALFALLLAAPSTEGGLFRKGGGCDSGCNSGQCIVGYKTEMRTVTVNEWVLEKRKVNVTEYKTFEEKQKVTRNKVEEMKETKPVTFTVNERVMEKRTEEYYTRELITKPETRTYTIQERVETKKTGTRKVGKPVTVTETRKVKKDMGAYEERAFEVVCNSSSCGKRRLCGRKSCDSGCETYTTTCVRRVWVPKIVEVEEKVNVVKTDWVEEKYDYVEVSYKPVQKTETVNVTRCELVKKSRTVDVWVCKPVTKTENRTFVTYKTTPVTEDVMVKVCRPVTVEKEVNVRVCRPVTKQVEVKVPIYGVVDCGTSGKCCK